MIGLNETLVRFLEDVCYGFTARVHIDNQVSEDSPVLHDVRQVHPMSSKLFTATIQEVFTNARLEEKGIDINGVRLTDLRFADDAILATEWLKGLGHLLL